MTAFAGIREKWNKFLDGLRATMAPVDNVLGKIGIVIRFIFRWLYRLRGILISIPVAIAAWRLAAYNKLHLPEEVGLNMLSNGEFGMTVSLQAAVMTPLFLTFGCLGLVLLSRKNLYPWIIAVFTLTVPLLLLMTNNFPALVELFHSILSNCTAA